MSLSPFELRMNCIETALQIDHTQHDINDTLKTAYKLYLFVNGDFDKLNLCEKTRKSKTKES